MKALSDQANPVMEPAEDTLLEKELRGFADEGQSSMEAVAKKHGYPY
jgi:hypothetical protein